MRELEKKHQWPPRSVSGLYVLLCKKNTQTQQQQTSAAGAAPCAPEQLYRLALYIGLMHTNGITSIAQLSSSAASSTACPIALEKRHPFDNNLAAPSAPEQLHRQLHRLPAADHVVLCGLQLAQLGYILVAAISGGGTRTDLTSRKQERLCPSCCFPKGSRRPPQHAPHSRPSTHSAPLVGLTAWHAAARSAL